MLYRLESISLWSGGLSITGLCRCSYHGIFLFASFQIVLTILKGHQRRTVLSSTTLGLLKHLYRPICHRPGRLAFDSRRPTYGTPSSSSAFSRIVLPMAARSWMFLMVVTSMTASRMPCRPAMPGFKRMASPRCFITVTNAHIFLIIAQQVGASVQAKI